MFVFVGVLAFAIVFVILCVDVLAVVVYVCACA